MEHWVEIFLWNLFSRLSIFFCILRCHRNLFVSLYEKKWVNLPYQIVCVEISKKLFTSSDIIFNTIFSCDSVETRVFFFVLFFSMEIIIIRLIISLLWGLETFSFMFDYLGNFGFILLSSWLLWNDCVMKYKIFKLESFCSIVFWSEKHSKSNIHLKIDLLYTKL